MENTEIAMEDDNSNDAEWLARQRRVVISYLESQQCNHGGLAIEPAWYVSPCVAVWPIQSRANPSRIGWWAISGDLPTDYMTATTQNAGDVLIAFADRWHAAAEQMEQGRHLDGFVIGNPDQAREFAPLLQVRAQLLREFGEDINSSGNE